MNCNKIQEKNILTSFMGHPVGTIIIIIAACAVTISQLYNGLLINEYCLSFQNKIYPFDSWRIFCRVTKQLVCDDGCESFKIIRLLVIDAQKLSNILVSRHLLQKLFLQKSFSQNLIFKFKHFCLKRFSCVLSMNSHQSECYITRYRNELSSNIA